VGPGTAYGQRRVPALLRTIAVDVGVVLTGVVVYFGVRGLTAGSPDVAVAHAQDLLALERTLGLDVEAAVQDWLLELDVVATLANWVYIWGHWPAIGLVLVWLALHDRRLFLRMRNAMVASGAMGLCVYTTYPVAPPRLLGEGFVDTVTEQSRAYRVLQPPAFVNQYAAMPSLHVGWDLVLGLTVAAAATTVVVRTVGRALPVVMAAATVITANHYVLDVLAGAAFGLAGWAVALWLEARRDRRSAAEPVVDLRSRPPAALAPQAGPQPLPVVDLRPAEVPQPRPAAEAGHRTPG
jgi:membrane-associated phospholipid phosphatase